MTTDGRVVLHDHDKTEYRVYDIADMISSTRENAIEKNNNNWIEKGTSSIWDTVYEAKLLLEKYKTPAGLKRGGESLLV